MSTIRGYTQSNYYDGMNTDFDQYNQNVNSFLSGISINNNVNNASNDAFSLADYAMIKNGSYKKLLKAYYKKEKTDGASGNRDSSQKLQLMVGNSNAMAKSVSNLMKSSLWESKLIKTKDEKTGEEIEKEDYDWNGIIKSMKSFVENYNKTVEAAAESNTKEVLRNAVWMTKTTSVSEGMLEKVGITIGSGNKLELDEEKLKEADINTLKNLFAGYNSYASKIYDKAQAITIAAARSRGSYNKSGKYSDVMSSILPSDFDKKE